MKENKNELINRLPPKARNGSKVRCHLLTDGSRDEVAARLTALINPWGRVRPADVWMPEGFSKTDEAQLHYAPQLLDGKTSKILQDWWLCIMTPETRTPYWDIASTCLIDGLPGMLLIEAKAHNEELLNEAKGRQLEPNPTEDSIKNHEHIGQAISNASSDLNKIVQGWNLNRDSHYQIVNRFAWSWKLSTLGIPVVLVYLGFLNAEEMQNRGKIIFKTEEHWRKLVLSYSDEIIPPSVWETKLNCDGSAFIPIIRTIETQL